MKDVVETLTLSLENLPDLVKKVLSLASEMPSVEGVVLFLEGDLGAGKTTFTQALAYELGVTDKVVSPTFILKKTYVTKNERFAHLVHVDAYRFEKEEEAKVLKLENDIKDPSTLVVIEWPYKIPYLKPSLLVEFETINEDTRKVTISYEK